MSKCILVVEDEQDIRDLYEENFIEEGYQVLCAADGSEAVKIAQASKIDLVVSDVKMPEGSGQTVALWFNTFRPRIPVIIVTAYSHYEDILMGAEKYVDAFFIKPVDMDELKEKIAELLRSKD
jgi:DNA-binding response OmpR family regulator